MLGSSLKMLHNWIKFLMLTIICFVFSAILETYNPIFKGIICFSINLIGIQSVWEGWEGNYEDPKMLFQNIKSDLFFALHNFSKYTLGRRKIWRKCILHSCENDKHGWSLSTESTLGFQVRTSSKERVFFILVKLLVNTDIPSQLNQALLFRSAPSMIMKHRSKTFPWHLTWNYHGTVCILYGSFEVNFL